MGNCPRCGLQTKKLVNTWICTCGWTHSNKKEASQTPVIVGLFLVFSLLSVGLFHFFQWGSHGFSILFAGQGDKIEICKDLKKYDCVEKAYQALFEQNGDIKILEELGELQFKRKKFEEAKSTYTLYFSKEGKSYKSAYYYAHSLSQTGDLSTAIQYFDSILKSNPNVLMVTIMESYLQILVSNNRHSKAKEVLAWMDAKNKGATNVSNQIEIWRKKFIL